MSSTANGPSLGAKTDKSSNGSPRVVLAGKTGRILCVADIRGDYHELNRLIRVHDATAVIHTGDFGFLNAESLERMNDKILRHLLEHSPLIPAATRAQLLDIPASAGRNALISALNASSLHFPLSQFPHLLDGAVTFSVPVFTNWGLIEDFRVLERFRTGEYEVKNLTIIDEASSGLIEAGGVKLRLFGLGGTVSLSKLFDHGEGHATIAGGQGVMWTTALQIGELLETAQRTFDPSETSLLITSSPIGRNGILSLLANALKADLTISGGLHFRYSSSFNDFAVHTDFADYRAKLNQARDEFLRIYTTVKDRVDSSLNDAQQSLLKQALSLTVAIPNTVEESTWANTWNWVLSDASCGHMILSITDGRVTAETKSRGLNFAHRAASQQQPIVAPPSVAQNARAPHQDAKVPAISRPGFSAVPTKPGHQAPTGPAAGVKGILPRPQPGQPPIGKQPPTGPAGSSALPPSIPARPPVQPRQPRVPPTSQTAPGKERAEKAPESALSKTAPKAPTPQAQANGKSVTPVPSAKEKEKGRPGATKKEVNGLREDARKEGEKEKKERSKKEEKKEEKAEDKETTTGGTFTPADGKAEDVKSTEDGESPATPEPRARKPSLYLKGIPSPTSEEEIKALFPDATKITAVKIIMDHVTKKQRDFAYVDFEADADMQEALKAHKDVIRETTINVTVSNPPSRTTFGPRGRGTFRRGGRPASGPLSGGAKKE